MKHDDRPDKAQRLEKARILRGFDSARKACLFFGWKYPTYIQHEQGRVGYEKSATKYALEFRVTESWLLTGDGIAPEEPKVPVLGFAAGSITGFNIIRDEPIDYVKRPPALENVVDGYALFIRGSSMEPIYPENELVFVHPHKVPTKGDFVIIQQSSTNGEPVAFIKRLAGKNDTYLIATQLNPPLTIQYKAETIIAVHKVLTTSEMFGV